MNLTHWKPFDDLDSIFKRSFMDVFRNNAMTQEYEAWQPSVDVSENDKQYVLQFQLPGVKKNDIKVDIRDGMITVSGERQVENKDEKQHRIESFYGSFSRTFTLPADVKEADITAKQKNGILFLYLNKSEIEGKTETSIPID